MRTRLDPTGEGGESLISTLIVVSGLMLPVLFLVLVFGRVEQARLAAAQAAREAVRAAVQAPAPGMAQAAAEQALARAQQTTSARLELQLSGTFAPGATLHAQVVGEVSLGSVPLLGNFGTIAVHAQAAAPVDLYRSLPGGSP